jgi:hypothetical protein
MIYASTASKRVLIYREPCEHWAVCGVIQESCVDTVTARTSRSSAMYAERTSSGSIDVLSGPFIRNASVLSLYAGETR